MLVLMPWHSRNSRCVSALILLACVLGALSACKTYYKRGGDAGALAADQAECQRRTGRAGGEPYLTCLRELGWATVTSEPDAGAGRNAAGVTTDTTHSGDSPEAEPVLTTPVVTKETLIDSSSARPPPEAIGSWFKLGGSPAQLKTDQADCMTRSHGASQSLSWSTDPDFLACMKARGWRALRQ